MNAEDLLSGKKVSFTQVEDINHENNEIVYKDKIMTISVNNGMVYISSKWWGKIKNSFFILKNQKPGKTELLHGTANLSEFVNYVTSIIVDVNRHNKANIKKRDDETFYQFLDRWSQAETGNNISYSVVSVNPVTVKLVIDGKFYYGEGHDKKIAANNAAQKAIADFGIEC